MGPAGQHLASRGRFPEHVGQPEPGGHHPLDSLVDLGPGGLTGIEVLHEVLGPDHPVGHLDVQAGVERPACVAETEQPVADHETPEPPLGAEDIGQEGSALAAPVAVDAVVRAHHRGHALVDDALEVGQVHLVEGDLVDGDVDGEAGVLHRVAGEVLDAGHGVSLHAPGQGGAHLADMVRVFPVGLLGPSPRRVAEHVHAHAAVQIGAHCPQLLADGRADPFLEVGVPGGPPGHADREAGRLVDHDPPRAVGEREAGQPDPLHGRGAGTGSCAARTLPGRSARPRRVRRRPGTRASRQG